MPDCHIRPFRSIDDAEPQYRLWLNATDQLCHAWRSCLQNVRHQLGLAEANPRSRLYAEGTDGTFLGYIGTHPPFEETSQRPDQERQTLGWAIPFGVAWTWPLDRSLEVVLYDKMIQATPDVYGDRPRDVYIQRFRESWTHYTGFLTERGWKLHDRLPLLGRAIGDSGRPPSELTPVTPADYAFVSELSSLDPTAAHLSAASLRASCDGGWIDPAAFWKCGDRGAFALEARGRSCAITVFAAAPDDWDENLRAAASKAAALGASEVYFTVDAHEDRLRRALDDRDFREVNAGVYYIRDAD